MGPTSKGNEQKGREKEGKWSEGKKGRMKERGKGWKGSGGRYDLPYDLGDLKLPGCFEGLAPPLTDPYRLP